MKRKISFIIVICIVFSLIGPHAFADEPNTISVLLNGTKLSFDVDPQIVNGRTMVPLRVIFEAIGASVEWDAATRTVTSVKNGKTVRMTIDELTVWIDGVPREMDVTPIIVNDRTLVPARFVAESFDAKVDWDGDSRTVTIATEETISKVPKGFTDGYVLAEFSRFNSWASENGLGGTKVYLPDCVITEISTLVLESEAYDLIYSFLRDKDGNRWLLSLNTTFFARSDEYNTLMGKPLTVCAEYEGYSEKFKLPTIGLIEVCANETGEIKSGLHKLTANTNKDANATTSTPTTNYDLSTSTGINLFLTDKYKSVETDMGTWNFSILVGENTIDSLPYDYDIFLKYDLGKMNELQFGIKYTQAQKEATKAQLKAFMKELADDIISKLPNKKFTGCYYYSYYKYPNLKLDLRVYNYCTWTNYEAGQNYYQTPVSTFRWYQIYDDEVW